MRADRNPYPFHHRQPQRPPVSIGYRPVTLPAHRKRRLLAGTAGYLFAVTVAAKALLGFFAL